MYNQCNDGYSFVIPSLISFNAFYPHDFVPKYLFTSQILLALATIVVHSLHTGKDPARQTLDCVVCSGCVLVSSYYGKEMRQ